MNRHIRQLLLSRRAAAVEKFAAPAVTAAPAVDENDDDDIIDHIATAADEDEDEDEDDDDDDMLLPIEKNIIEQNPQKLLSSDGWEFTAAAAVDAPPLNADITFIDEDTFAAEEDFAAEDFAPDQQRKYFQNLDKHDLSSQGRLGVEDMRQPFESLRAMMSEDLLGDGGVMKHTSVIGSGPQVSPGSRVTAHYVGQFEKSDAPFDSTYVRGNGNPEQFLVGNNSKLLAGLNYVLLTMKKGETALALISAEYAYGKMGCGPRIPPNSDVLFEITVISFANSTVADEFNDLSKEQKKRATFEQWIGAIRCHHAKGNDNYVRGAYRNAAASYYDALHVFKTKQMSSFNQSIEQERLQYAEAKQVIFKVMSNRVQAFLQLGQWKEAVKQGQQALLLKDAVVSSADDDRDELLTKLYTRLAKAMIYIQEFDKAYKLLERAKHLKPCRKDINTLVELLTSQQKVYASKQMNDKLWEVAFAKRAIEV